MIRIRIKNQQMGLTVHYIHTAAKIISLLRYVSTNIIQNAAQTDEEVEKYTRKTKVKPGLETPSVHLSELQIEGQGY